MHTCHLYVLWNTTIHTFTGIALTTLSASFLYAFYYIAICSKSCLKTEQSIAFQVLQQLNNLCLLQNYIHCTTCFNYIYILLASFKNLSNVLYTLDFDTSKAKQPVASRGLSPQTPCFRYPLLDLAPPLEHSRCFPVNIPLTITNIGNYQHVQVSMTYDWMIHSYGFKNVDISKVKHNMLFIYSTHRIYKQSLLNVLTYTLKHNCRSVYMDNRIGNNIGCW